MPGNCCTLKSAFLSIPPLRRVPHQGRSRRRSHVAKDAISTRIRHGLEPGQPSDSCAVRRWHGGEHERISHCHRIRWAWPAEVLDAARRPDRSLDASAAETGAKDACEARCPYARLILRPKAEGPRPKRRTKQSSYPPAAAGLAQISVQRSGF